MSVSRDELVKHYGTAMLRKSILNLAALVAQMLPATIKRRIYQYPTLSRLIRGGLNQVVPQGLVRVEIAAGALQGHTMILDLQTEKDYWLGTYEPELQSAVLEWVKPGMVVYDVGANIGYFTLQFALVVGDGGKVISFEALPQNVERLKNHLIESNLERRVRVESCAVVDQVGTVSFWTGPSSGTGKAAGSKGRKNLAYGQSTSVPGISLDAYVYEQGNPIPDVIKMDIEGGEALAFPGMTRLISSARPLILLELHGSEAAQIAWKTLAQNRYRIRRLKPGYPRVTAREQLDWKSYILAEPES